jgi:hypothetical protein
MKADRRSEIVAKIEANIDIRLAGYKSPCWLWTASDSGSGRGGGYPRMKVSGQTCAAHKVSFTHFHGYIPGKKHIDHLCRNRLFVNPDHLELVTPKRNHIRQREANGTRAVKSRRRKRATGIICEEAPR